MILQLSEKERFSMNEKEIRQQDSVDNAIHNFLLTELTEKTIQVLFQELGSIYKGIPSIKTIESEFTMYYNHWDIESITKIRHLIQDEVIRNSDLYRNEKEFYP